MSMLNAKKWIETQFASTTGSENSLNALVATFQLSVLRTLSLGITTRMHEEPATSFLLGAFASYAQFCSAAFGSAGKTKCYWRYYPKNGTDLSGEAITGSDFALIVECEGRRVRLAIFQAKSEESAKKESFSFHQLCEPNSSATRIAINPDRPPSPTLIPQFLRFLEHAKRIGRDATGQDVVLGHIHWAHYLVYGSKAMQCLSINQLGDVFEVYQTRKRDGRCADPGRIRLGDYTSRHFFSLLTMGATPESSGLDLTGWLEIDPDQVEAMKNSLLLFCDVHIATHGPAPEPEPSSDGHNSPKPPDETPKSLLDLFREETATEKFRDELMQMRPDLSEQSQPEPEPEPEPPGDQPIGPSSPSRSGRRRR